MAKKFIVTECKKHRDTKGRCYPPCPYYYHNRFGPDSCLHQEVKVLKIGIGWKCWVPKEIDCDSGVPSWCPLGDDV